MTRTLGEVVATEKAARQRANKLTGETHKTAQKASVFGGLSRTYKPFADDGVQLPPEGNSVQLRLENMLNDFAAAFTPALDLAAAKDKANTQARGNVVLADGTVVLEDVPISHLLFLEHQLAEVHTFVSALVTLDPAEKWELNEQTGLYESAPSFSTRVERHEVPLVLHAPTREHPAQVKVTQEEKPVGTWTSVKFSGAIPGSRKRQLIERVEALQDAVKTARERANQIAAPPVSVGAEIFGYLFS